MDKNLTKRFKALDVTRFVFLYSTFNCIFSRKKLGEFFPPLDDGHRLLRVRPLQAHLQLQPPQACQRYDISDKSPSHQVGELQAPNFCVVLKASNQA